MAASTDAQSGVASYSFPALGSGWSGAASGADDAYTFTAAAGDPSEPNDVHATNAAGLDSSATSFTVTADGTAPSTSIQCDGAACPAGWFTTSPVSVALSATDGGSGVDHIAYTTDGSDPTGGGTTYSGAFTVAATTTVRYAAYDNVGNVGSVNSATVRIDTTAPSTAAVLANATGSVYLGSATAFYRPGGSGSFDITATVSDAQSGVQKASFPSASGFGSGGDVTAPGPYSFNYFYSGTPSEPGSVDVVGHNNAGLTSTDSVSITADATAPTSSMSCDGSPCGAGWSTSAPVAIALAASDGGSGLDHIAYTTDGSDPTAAGTTYSAPFNVGASTTVKWAAYDRVGNVESVQSKTIQIDTTAPSTPTLSVSALTNAVASGNTVYFRPGIAGGFNLSASSNDGESGVASYSFPALGAGWSAAGTGASRAYSFTNAAGDPAEPNDVTATNNAGQTSTPASLTVTADSSGPSGGSVDYVDGFRSSASVALTLDKGTDSGAGLDPTSGLLERSVATLSNGTCTGFSGFSTLAVDPALAYADLTVTTGHCYMYRYTVQDLVGNAQTYTTTAVAKVDLDPPAATQGNPGLYLHGTVTLTGTATDTGGSDVAGLAFQYSDDSGATWKPISTDTTSPYSASFDTTTAATPDGVYDLRTVATDGAGNSSPSPVVSARRIDNTPPSASISSPAANVRGVVSLTATVSDSGSGISTTAYQFSSDGGATWTSTPASWNTALTSDGIYQVRVVATDNAGNQATDTSGSFRVDNTPPVAVMDDPGAYLRGTVNLTSTATDAGSSVATVTYERSPAGANSWTSMPAAWDTVPVTDAVYDLRVVVVDNAGNRTDSAVQTSLVDNTKPSVSLDSPTSNSDVAGTVTLTSTASDAGSGLAGLVTYEYRTHPAGTWTATPAAWDTTLLADGGYDLRATAIDRAGNSQQSNVANVRVDNTPPTISLTAPADGGYVNAASPDPYSLAGTANDAGSGVKQVEFFQCSDTSIGCATGTWSSVGIHAAPGPYSVAWAIPADGHRALRAVATDNADRTASSLVDVTVDRTPPDTTIITKPGDPSNEASPTFTFSSTEAGSTFECSLDGGAFGPCSSPDVLAALTDGTHDFAVRAIDPAGNTDASPATWTWLTDLTPPTATMDNPGVNVRGVVSLTSSQDDPGGANASGVASVSYEYSADGGTSWAPTPASWDTAPITDGIYQLRVIVVDNAGNQTIDTLAADVRVDNTAPSSSQDDPGQYLRGSITLTGSAADPDDPAGHPGSGVIQVRFEVSPAGADAWTAVGTAASAPYSATLDTATLADGRYDFRTFATDAAGNEAPGGTVTNRLVDNTAPTASMGDPGANLRGTVTLASTTADPGANASGVASVDYEVSSGSGWTPVPDNWSTSSMPDGLYDLRVTATDRAGNSTTSSTVGGRRVDNTPPSTSDDAPSGYSSSDVTVNLSANDSGSGVSVTEYSVDGGGFQAGSSVTIPAPSNGSNDGTHTISYFSADVAGNIEATKTTTVQIDATPPVCPACTANDYLRGTETLRANPSSSLSGIKSVTFEYANAGAPRTLPPPGTWHTIGVDTTAPYSVDWNTTGVSDGAYDLRILVKNNANNTSITYLDSKVVDNTAPTAGVGAPAAGALVSGSVTFAATTSDANPIASVEFFVGGRSLGTVGSAPFRTGWDTTGDSDGSASLHVVVTDIAGNSTTSASRTVTIDNNAPQPSLGDPGAGISGSVTLTASSDSDTVRVDIQRSPAGANRWTTIGSPTSAPFSVSFDSTFLVDGSYDLRAVATDQSGHVGTSPIVTTRVDNTAPTVSLTRPTAGAMIGGPAAPLTAAASDSTSGVASVRFQYRPTGGGGFTDIADDTSSPYAVSWDATTVATGSYDLRAVATDAAGNVAMSSPVTVSVDSTAPIVVLDDPGANLSGTVTLTATTSGSPAARVTFERSPAGASNWTPIATDSSAPWSASFDTTAVADGLYDLRAVAADAVGNERASVRSGIRIDNSAPRLVSSTPADGAVIASATSIVLVASENLAAIDGATLDGAGVVAPILSGAQATYPVGTVGPGPHTLAGLLRDESGKTRAFQVHFTIWTSGGGGGGSTPYVEENSARDRSTTVTAPGDGASVTMPQGAWPANGNDWIVVRIEMNPAPSGLAGALTFESGVADVTAHWALSGAQLHVFEQPLTITIASSGTNVAAATFDGSTWRVLRRVPTPGTLPAGWSDGYWSDGSGVHILTLHLSQFAVVRDLTPPADSGSGGGSDTGGGSGSGSGSDGTTTTETTTTSTTTTTPHPQTRLSMRVAATKVFRPGHQVRIGARIVSTKKATGTVTLRSADGSQLATWAFKVESGSNVLLFKMPASVRKPGHYTLAWRLVAAGDSVEKVTKLTISGAVAEWTLVGAVPARPDVVLAAPGFSVRSLALPRSVRVLETSAAADAFDLTAGDATNVRVVVLDVDRLGLNYLHDLHTVFPTVRIVAIANDPAIRRRALNAGAAVALPHTAGPARVGAAVRRLAQR
ncbi:MAG TPA: Ig-like domain-containing protein [Gaiellaceae bacterium]